MPVNERPPVSAHAGPFIPRRHVHLDFHTGPAIPDVGADFDPEAFARTFVETGADAVTVFAKCHHGHLYLDTDHPARHPGLPDGLDLVGEQVEALHRVGIRAPIYISVQCDEYAADTHPEWIAIEPDLRQVKRGAASTFDPAWQILDMSSPYQDYLADQLDLVLRRFAPVDGIFLDMCWDQPSVSRWALDGMRRAGLDPRVEGDRARYARGVARTYMARFRDMINQAQRAHDGARPASIFFNSRPRTLAGEERDLSTHQEIEALPTGGWGYSYTPYVARFVRALGLPAFGMTGRFHESWGDNAGLKPAAALRYECAQLAALGMGASVGDLLHPRGATNPVTYRLIGEVFAHLRACEPFCDGAEVATEVALLVTGEAQDRSHTGAVRMLQQCRQQFDVVTPDADLSGYRLVVVPESTPPEASRDAVGAFVRAGGPVLVMGRASADAGSAPLLPELGVEIAGESPYTHTFLRLGSELAAACAAPADFDTVVYERGLRLRPGAGATALAHVVEPYFERAYDRFSGHSYTAPDRVSDDAAIVEHRVGAGRVVTVAEPLFETFATHANVAYRQIVGALLDRLLPDPLLRAGGPAHLETSVQVRPGGGAGPERTVAHLVSFLPSRQGTLDLVTDPFPLVDVPVAIRRAVAPSKVSLQPGGVGLDFEHRDGYVTTRVTVLDGHAMIVCE